MTNPYMEASLDWYPKAARMMIREGKTLYQVLIHLDRPIKSSEADAIVRTASFQDHLRIERNLLYKELANDPTRGRNTAVGMLIHAINMMLDAQQWDKATKGIMDLAKLEGWTNDNTVNIFQDLTGRDLEALRKKFKDQSPGQNPSIGTA
jgi:hypothetical protein